MTYKEYLMEMSARNPVQQKMPSYKSLKIDLINTYSKLASNVMDNELVNMLGSVNATKTKKQNFESMIDSLGSGVFRLYSDKKDGNIHNLIAYTRAYKRPQNKNKYEDSAAPLNSSYYGISDNYLKKLPNGSNVLILVLKVECTAKDTVICPEGSFQGQAFWDSVIKPNRKDIIKSIVDNVERSTKLKLSLLKKSLGGEWKYEYFYGDEAIELFVYSIPNENKKQITASRKESAERGASTRVLNDAERRLSTWGYYDYIVSEYKKALARYNKAHPEAPKKDITNTPEGRRKMKKAEEEIEAGASRMRDIDRRREAMGLVYHGDTGKGDGGWYDPRTGESESDIIYRMGMDRYYSRYLDRLRHR